ncbi:MAG: bifunctional (p)ppGpp synthetase/guanosine-3',5'-bis(diphosphate) 3'-pyrophosphohydrolase [Deltaproteobacteria bacterium]|nr:bifunctional (p)ppGpp synthetase/guanosine-3',5'-bis(diphosphate) 3'-pyrophosphohydrolase [Deltaproteobacteria bacterium]
MIRLNDITSQVLSYHPKADIELIEKAYVYSAKVHQGQIRLSGEPYLSHPLEAAYILTQLKMDVTCIAAGLLHDVIEDTHASLEEITAIFGEETANIVDGVTKISKIQFKSSKQRQAENVRKMILAMSTDIRVILVKLADRLHNMRTLGFQSEEKQRSIATETLDIYAPLAGRMGINWVKYSLEDLCLFYLEPEIYARIKDLTARRQSEMGKLLKEIQNTLTEELAKANIPATVKGRQKHFYSIYQKMVDQDLEVSQVYDILAFRVIVKTIKECYAALGHIHSAWKPVSKRFKDYISVPKANMYQSLHTTVFGPARERMEVQIRTWDMNRVAESGIAAHWKYKEGGVTRNTDEKQFAWLNELLDWQKTLEDPQEFLDTVKMDLFPDEVYVFTPTGEVKSFPKGATMIDFAYGIHSEVGEKCTGAKVDGRMVPLRTQLKNGNIIEVITSSKQHPRKDWLSFVKTPRAKTRIRHWIKTEGRDESIVLGKSILEKTLQQEKLTVPNLLKSEQIAAVAKELSFQSGEDLIAQIGFGKISPRQVVGRLKPKLTDDEESPQGLVGKMVSRFTKPKGDHGIKVDGVSDVMLHFANCCQPLPGENVIGFITRGSGVTIHNENCQHVKEADPNRLVAVSWEPSEKSTYPARLRVSTVEGKGVLADISTILSRKDANITQAEVKTTVDHKGISLFTIEVEDYAQLQDIIRSIKKVKNVLVVERLQDA